MSSNKSLEKKATTVKATLPGHVVSQNSSIKLKKSDISFSKAGKSPKASNAEESTSIIIKEEEAKLLPAQ